MCRILRLVLVLLAASSAFASSLRQKSGQQQLFGECTNLGQQCHGISHSICAEAPTRLKRNVADSELMMASMKPKSSLRARGGLQYAGESDDNNDDDSGGERVYNREVRGKTTILPPVVRETEKTNVINSVKHIYKDIHTRSRVNIDQKVVQKHVYIHDIKNIHRDLIVNHVNHNHHTDIVKHVQPILNELYITREQKIVQPIEKTVVTHSESESRKEIVHPTVVRNKYENVQLPTVVEKTRYLGNIDGGASYRSNGDDGERINKGDELGNEGGYGGEGLEKRSAAAAALARFKRATDGGAAAVCMCAEGFGPSKFLDGCV